MLPYPKFPVDLVKFTEEILNGKLHFLCSVNNLAVNKDKKAKVNCTDNDFHNILRLFDVLPNFPFTISETMRDYYL